MTFLDTPSAFFEEAVASVHAQTFTDWELVLVNDGSGPSATALAQRFVQDAPDRVRCVSHDGGINRGIPASRNLGISHARGELIAFLDSDDVWFPTALAEQVAVMRAAPEAWMVFGRSLYWHSWRGETHGAKDNTPPLGVPGGTTFPPPEFLHRFLRWQVIVPCPSSITARATALKAIGGFEERLPMLYEDQCFYAKMALAGPVIASDAVWSRYRIHAASAVQSSSRAVENQSRLKFLDWLSEYAAAHGHTDPGFLRTVNVERRALTIPGAPRILRSLRRLVALPGRLRAMLS